MDEVIDISLKTLKTPQDIIRSYHKMGGFMSRLIGEAYYILKKVIEDEDTALFMSFPADIIATGLRGIIADIIKLGWVDIIITTCGTWDHDIARTFNKYYVGSFYTDDKKLVKRDIHRLGNIFIPKKSYGEIIEQFVKDVLKTIYKEGIRTISTYELSWTFGRMLDESSLLWNAWNRNIPVIIPGPYDGAVGSQIWIFQQFHKEFQLNLKKDEDLLSKVVFESKKTAALIIGGGIAKHHLLWWNQYRGGLDYAVQITTAIELDGSLSGARLNEAVTWGKINVKADNVSIWGDATIILPVLIAALYQNMK